MAALRGVLPVKDAPFDLLGHDHDAHAGDCLLQHRERNAGHR